MGFRRHNLRQAGDKRELNSHNAHFRNECQTPFRIHTIDYDFDDWAARLIVRLLERKPIRECPLHALTKETRDIRMTQSLSGNNPMAHNSSNPNKSLPLYCRLSRPPIRGQLPFGRRVGHGVIQTCHPVAHGLGRPAQPVVADEHRLFGGVAG